MILRQKDSLQKHKRMNASYEAAPQAETCGVVVGKTQHVLILNTNGTFECKMRLPCILSRVAEDETMLGGISMKKYILYVLIVCVMLLCACRSLEQQPTVGVGTNPMRGEQTTAPTMTTQPTEPKPTDPQPTEPTNEELAKFNALFGNLDSWYNKALICEYATPAQVDLYMFFLAAFNEDSNQITDSEIAGLKDIYGDNPDYAANIENYDITRLPVDRMNQVLQDYFGITLDAVDAAGFDDMDYLESANCYYIIGGGTSVTMDFNALSVETLEDGTIRVHYTANYENTVYVVTLMPHGDGYRILSNVRVE